MDFYVITRLDLVFDLVLKGMTWKQIKYGYETPYMLICHCAFDSDIPAKLGCAMDEAGYLMVDPFQKTTVDHAFACGDNTTIFRFDRQCRGSRQ